MTCLFSFRTVNVSQVSTYQILIIKTRENPESGIQQGNRYSLRRDLCRLIPPLFSDKMPTGKLQVLLVNAKGLHDTEFFNKMDPYVIITCRTQEQKSNVASGQGSSPEWNETFVFSVSGDVPELVLKIKDSDVGTEDDFVGEAKIPLATLFVEGSIPPTPYNVVINDEFCGEIKVGLQFIPEEINEEGHHHHGEEGQFGGWKESSY
ncbi:hypothetical protein L2E82_47525 [Cichorium intybus]|uniref:Uncharacterized protein n=1 Tax=Cichorium intybus TaxID=13427 RepID=A0ACB8YUY2_CICIN|nr:hypothetical protein L2E82_47525 [Cichorium intybus]